MSGPITSEYWDSCTMDSNSCQRHQFRNFAQDLQKKKIAWVREIYTRFTQVKLIVHFTNKFTTNFQKYISAWCWLPMQTELQGHH